MPVKRVDALRGLGVQVELAVIKIRADERVAALNVAVQIGQHALMEQLHLAVQRLAGFAFQHFEQQREFGHFHRLRVDVHAIDMIEQDAFLF